MSLDYPVYKFKNWIDKYQINWKSLSANENAIYLLMNNYDKINWKSLCRNTNKKAIELVSKRPEKIDWTLISENGSAIELLEQNQDKINWSWLSLNPAIFELDYEKMKKNKNYLNFFQEVQ